MDTRPDYPSPEHLARVPSSQREPSHVSSQGKEAASVTYDIDLINTLGDMVDQKEEAKMEKFIETMPTMIQIHLIICKDWADIKDKAKSLEHII